MALGTNSVATGQMLKAGADDGATGENAIIHNMQHVDIVMGVIGIINANSMMGEMSPAMASAIGGSHTYTASDKPLPHTYRQRRRAVCQRSCRQCRESARPFTENKVVLEFKDM